MFTRRQFLKTAATGAGVVFLDRGLRAGTFTADYFGIHQFIEDHPDAVFILRTAVGTKTDTEAVKGVGLAFGRSIFVTKASAVNAYPVSGPVAIKPNLTAWAWNDPTPSPSFEKKMGIHTDANFVEGMIGSLCELAVLPADVHLRDGNYSATGVDGAWYAALAARTGVDLQQKGTVSSLSPADIQWTAVSNGVWYTRIPHLWPVNAPGACLINIAKLKSHSMGMTLCSKNLQGVDAQPYIGHCRAWNTPMSGVSQSDIVPNAFSTIRADYDRHKATIPRWMTLDGDATSGSAGGLWMETHTARCLDNNSALAPAINIIEGIYGREGPFVVGPGSDGLGIDVMANLVIFGKNGRHVDLIGTYLAGHEPGNFGLFHIARERGLSKYLNPNDVPLYEWKTDGSAIASSLTQFTRVPIRTLYLPQAGEAQYHMVDQPFDYTSTSVATRPEAGPDAVVIEQNFPNPFNPTTSIQYSIPRAGHVRLEVFDLQGDLVDLLVDGLMTAGDHLVSWDSGRRASGTYFYRIRFGGMSRTRSMILLR